MWPQYTNWGKRMVNFCQDRMWRNYYEYLCVLFLIGTDVIVYCSILLSHMSEVIRAEAETCFPNINMKMPINFLMLLLFLMITSQAVHTKVQTTKNTMIRMV